MSARKTRIKDVYELSGKVTAILEAMKTLYVHQDGIGNADIWQQIRFAENDLSMAYESLSDLEERWQVKLNEKRNRQ